MKPTRFVGLHAHSVLSIGDGLGRPKEHIDFAIENGMDALALTDHGNMDGFAEQLFTWEKYKKEGKNFKAIPGIEAYFIDSLETWKTLYDEQRLANANAKLEAKKSKKAAKSKSKQEFDLIGDENAVLAAEVEELYNKQDTNEETAIMENEAESKSYSKFFDPIKQRNHLVLLPKNTVGLKSLFRIVSESYKDGFYKYPRVDLNILQKHSNGNIIASSACLAGKLSAIVAMNQTKDFSNSFQIEALNDNKEEIQKELAKMVYFFQEALGKENFYLELQFNKIPLQHIINYHLMECSKRTGAKLIVTCDSHYARPEYWREREIYKAMIWASKTKGSLSADELPKKIDELKCELYPKNAEQVWDSYLLYGKPLGFYNDEVIKDAIELTWDIAHHQISDDVMNLDKSVKLPSINKIVTQNEILLAEEKLRQKKKKEINIEDIAFEILKNHAIDGLIAKGLHENKEYVDRLIVELDTIRALKITNYFLTYEKIMQIVSEKMLTGAGRGSAAGSLLAYLLGITQIDPIKFGLLFERFLSKKKASMADIDSDSSDRDYALKIITEFFGEDSVLAISTFGQLQLKSLIRDLGRLYDVPLDEIGEVTLATDKETRAHAKKQEGYDGTTWFLTYDEAKQNSPTFNRFIEKYPEIEQSIKVLFKNFRSIGRHAGGVIISDNVYNNMPVRKSGNVMQTPWTEGLNGHQLEPLGFLKFDILAVGTLRIIENTIRKIIAKETKRIETEVPYSEVKEWFYQKLHCDNNPMDDKAVYEFVYHKGNWGGIFQFAQPPARNFAQRLKPYSIEDISACTSIFRPGPLSAGVDKLYLENKNNPESVQYKHPMLKDILKNEAGCLAASSIISGPDNDITIEQAINETEVGLTVPILSYNEETKEIEEDWVIGGICTGIKETYTVEFDDGTTLTLTEDHIVYTKNGEKQMKDLTDDDEILGIKD